MLPEGSSPQRHEATSGGMFVRRMRTGMRCGSIKVRRRNHPGGLGLFRDRAFIPSADEQLPRADHGDALLCETAILRSGYDLRSFGKFHSACADRSSQVGLVRRSGQESRMHVSRRRSSVTLTFSALGAAIVLYASGQLAQAEDPTLADEILKALTPQSTTRALSTSSGLFIIFWFFRLDLLLLLGGPSGTGLSFIGHAQPSLRSIKERVPCDLAGCVGGPHQAFSRPFSIIGCAIARHSILPIPPRVISARHPSRSVRVTLLSRYPS
jgi:hypothetical protein